MNRCSTRNLLWGFVFLALTGTIRAAEPYPLAPPPQYPPITLSTWYEVDPSWPQRPEGMPLGRTPGIFVDGKDQVWIFTRAIPPVQVYTTEGKFVRAWGEGLIGSTPTSLGSHQIRIDHEGLVWLADTANHVVLKCTPEGKLLQTLGTPGRYGCDESLFNRPTDMAITPDGQVFVSDGYGNARIVHFDAQGKFVKQWGKQGTGPGEFSLPHAIALDSKGRLYVADRNNARIQVFEQSGRFVEQWQNIMVPWGIWITADDAIWVCGCSPMPWAAEDKPLSCPPKDQLIVRFDVTGRVRQLWTIPKGTDGEEKPGELNWVHGIAVDRQGNVYATDIIGERAQKFVRHN